MSKTAESTSNATAATAESAAEMAEFEDTYFDQPEVETVDLSTLGKATWLVLKIIVPIVIGCFVVTLIWASVTAAIVATFVVTMLSVFIAIPLFLACVEDEIMEAEHH